MPLPPDAHFCEDHFITGARRSSPGHERVITDKRGELLGPDANPSRDYVMTEVVHCKSTGETGVARAAPTCAGRYLEEILSLTAAPVVVVVGKQAHAMLKLWSPGLCDPVRAENLVHGSGQQNCFPAVPPR